jgi:hypothetical protein
MELNTISSPLSGSENSGDHVKVDLRIQTISPVVKNSGRFISGTHLVEEGLGD